MKYLLLLILLFACGQPAAASVPLVAGTEDNNSYGYYFNGVTAQREVAEFSFNNAGSDFSITVTGFDIDISDEVQVFLNGSSIGFLNVSGNKATSTSTLLIPLSSQVNGANTIEFRQRVPGWMWGVTDLRLDIDDKFLALNEVESRDFGYHFNGVTSNRDSAFFSFNNSGSSLSLSIAGFDIDLSNEVQVFVNGTSIGYLSTSGNKATSTSTLLIPISAQVSGTNSIEFRQLVPGWMWGITDLLITIHDQSINDNILALDEIESRSFGFYFNGVTLQKESAFFTFQYASYDVNLAVAGYDIDLSNEVQVFVNGISIGYLSTSGNKATSTSTLLIPLGSQIPGENSIEFRQRVPGWMWGVTDLLLTTALVDPVPKLANYELVFADDFNAPAGSGLDPTKWDTGLLWGPYFPINNEEQMYVDTLGMHSGFSHSPFELTGSTLRITATPISTDLQPPPRPPETSPLWQPRSYSEYRYNGPTADGEGYKASDVNYLSGIITSYDSLKMTHGYVEMRAKLPPGRGLWPAFWLLTSHYVQDVPEIDVMEFLGQDLDRLYHSYHYFDISNNWQKVSTPSYPSYAVDWTDSFHTFGMAWGPTEIIWYVDGVETRRITDADYIIAGQAMYLLANLAVGGNWPGAPDFSTPFPAIFEIDYIRAYKRKLNPQLDLAGDYQVMFEDEFNGNSLDGNKWNTHFLWGPYLPINNEEQYYVDTLGSDSATVSNSPFQVDGGILSITARPTSNSDSFPIPQTLPELNDPVWTNFPTFQRNQDYSPGNYTSGIITSYDAFKFAYGYAEMRAKIPKGDGLWPAFWLLNGYYISQQPEIDIMEVRGENPHQIVHSYHRLSDGAYQSSSATTDNGNPAIGYADDFHTYGVRWQPGRIDWYIDGVVTYTYENADVGYQLMYVIANLAVGGDFNFSPVDPLAVPASLDIDYIRVYQARHFD